MYLLWYYGYNGGYSCDDRDYDVTSVDNIPYLFLPVPGLLEFESIPAVSSSKPFGRTNMRQRTRSNNEEITVKTITKYVSEVLLTSFTAFHNSK